MIFSGLCMQYFSSISKRVIKFLNNYWFRKIGKSAIEKYCNSYSKSIGFQVVSCAVIWLISIDDDGPHNSLQLVDVSIFGMRCQGEETCNPNHTMFVSIQIGIEWH